MNADDATTIDARLTRVARAAAGSAAIGAGLMLLFGFGYLDVQSGDDLFAVSAQILYYTVRWGGVALGLIAVALFAGVGIALVADGVVSGLVGVLLIVTGLGMAIDGGGLVQPIINFVCGYMFFSSGVRNGRAYFRLTERRGEHDARNEPAKSIQATERSDRVPVVGHPQVIREENKVPEKAIENTADDSATSPPPPGGFLASFANKDPRDEK
jgi:hypothetical protein